MKKTFRILLPLLALLAVSRPAVASETAKAFSPRSAVSKIDFQGALSTAPVTETFYWRFKTPGTLVDLVCSQVSAGTGGTSVSFDIQKNGVSMLTTLGTITLAAGADKSVDLKREIAAVSGCTRPVAKTFALIRVNKGDKITLISTESGTYSPHPTYKCQALFLPDE